MSYCRFLEADAYIYDDVYHGIICCACLLLDEGEMEYSEFFKMELPKMNHFVAGYDRQKMLDHIAEHRHVHHYIPLDVDERLKEEMKNIEEYMAGARKHIESCHDLWCVGCEK